MTGTDWVGEKTVSLPDTMISDHLPTSSCGHKNSSLNSLFRLEEQHCLCHPNEFDLFGMQHDNTALLPDGIETEPVEWTHFCEQIHHEDPAWPLVCPDAFAPEEGGEIKFVEDDAEARRIFQARYEEHNKQVAKDGKNLFQNGRRFYVPGALFHNVADRFFIPEMKQPTTKPATACRRRSANGF